jgi:hypothetical protein
MPMCGFSPKMLQGLTMFAQGLYESAILRAKGKGVPIEIAMEEEINEMNVFLAALDEHYDDLKTRMNVDEAMRELVRWTTRRVGEGDEGNGRHKRTPPQTGRR